MTASRDALLKAFGFLFGQPHFLIFFVTTRCNLACGHCLVPGLPGPDEGQAGELTLDEIRKVAASMPPVGSLSITGGEPFLRDDLTEAARAFIDAGKTTKLDIVTNGWFPDRVAATAEALLRTDLRRLSVKVSLDGPPSVHDAIRGQAGSFDRALASLERLQRLRRRDPRLRMGSITAYQEANRGALRDFLPFLTGLGLDTASLILTRGAPRDPSAAPSDLAEYHALYDAFNSLNPSPVRRAYKALVQDLQKQAVQARCSAGSTVAVLRENGDLHACERKGRRLASLREHGWDFQRAWRCAGAARTRAMIRGSCRECSWECVLPYDIVTTPGLLLRFGWRTLLEAIRKP